MHHPFTDPLASVLARCRSSTQVSWDDCGRSSGRTLFTLRGDGVGRRAERLMQRGGCPGSDAAQFGFRLLPRRVPSG